MSNEINISKIGDVSSITITTDGTINIGETPQHIHTGVETLKPITEYVTGWGPHTNTQAESVINIILSEMKIAIQNKDWIGVDSLSRAQQRLALQ